MAAITIPATSSATMAGDDADRIFERCGAVGEGQREA
jgi:hypothetical protein